METEDYEVPKFAVKPYPGDTGYEYVRNNYDRSKYSAVDLEAAKHKTKLSGTTDPAPDKGKVLENIVSFDLFEADTSAYPAPTTAIKPQKGDTGYALTKSYFDKGETHDLIWRNKDKKKKKTKVKSMTEFFAEENFTPLLESQQFFFEDKIDSDKVFLSNVPGNEGAAADIKWALQLANNRSGVDQFIVEVKGLSIKWEVESDQQKNSDGGYHSREMKSGEVTVKSENIKVVVKGDLTNLYAESVEYDNKTGEAEVRFGKEKED